ncbi:MAG: alkaline phosphatase D family protein [Acidobacteria bacterium]|nr:alkaline phosphatase D family protein [Acidobacteriota bacterium]
MILVYSSLMIGLVLLGSIGCKKASVEHSVHSEIVTVTHGPILGRIGAHEIAVWGRTSQPGTLRVRYGLEPNKLDMQSSLATTRLEDDNTGYVHLRGLKSRTKYYYQIVASDEELGPHPGGSFHTLPESDDVRHPVHNPRGLFNFRFEVGDCNNQNAKWYGTGDLPTYKTMLDQLKDKVDFAILNGDWLYEEKREYRTEQWLRQVNRKPAEMPYLVQLAPSIVGVWENYKLYLERGKNLAAWHAAVPSFFTYDDHDILNDVYGTGTAGRRDRPAVFRDIAVQAWYHYLGWSNPVEHQQGIYFGRAELKAGSDILTDLNGNLRDLALEQATNLHVHWGGPAAGVNEAALNTADLRQGAFDDVGGDPNAGVYDIHEVLDNNRLRIWPKARQDGISSFSIGRRSYCRFKVSNCEFFLLDTRGQREMHDVRYPRKPGLSMLGQQQRAWLLDAMAKSDADFFFVVSSVNLTIPHRGAGGIVEIGENKDEAWTVFLDEREQLIRFWDSLGKPVFLLTGDLHNSFAIRITGRVWEFASGPHGSINHTVGSEGGRPANGAFDSMGRKVDIRWSSYILDDTPPELRRRPLYCVVQVNNVFNNPIRKGEDRWVTFPFSQVIFQYHDGLTGELLYAEPILSAKKNS